MSVTVSFLLFIIYLIIDLKCKGVWRVISYHHNNLITALQCLFPKMKKEIHEKPLGESLNFKLLIIIINYLLR